MKALMNRFMNDESGQGLTEYALIIAIVAIGVIAAMVLFRDQIGQVFRTTSNTLNSAPVGQTTA
jgi:pilus assembly protein Flp/PilA